MDKPPDEARPDPFVRHGAEDQRIEIGADEVLEAIAEGRDVDIEYAVIRGDLNIAKVRDRLEKDERGNAVIPGVVRVTYSQIQRADFAGTTFFQHAHFWDATFSQWAVFRGATFSQRADFRDATFSQSADFEDASFSHGADLSGATFSQWADFCRAAFPQGADFSFATFSQRASFSGATFSQAAYFRHATFSQVAVFGGATFSQSADFVDATFSQGAFFTAATFSQEADFTWAGFWGSPDFTSAGIAFPGSFRGVRLHENTTPVGLHNDVWCPLVRWLTRGKVKPRKKPVTDFSRLNTTTIMDASSNPYLKRYIEDEQWIASWRARSRWHKFLFYVWELTCHCGRSFALWLFWTLLAAAIFGFIYAPYHAPSWLPLKSVFVSLDPHLQVSPAVPDRMPTRLTPYYFSIVTFTTLGFGDVTPLNLWGEIWLALEVLLGYIMLGGLISILANKLARRS